MCLKLPFWAKGTTFTTRRGFQFATGFLRSAISGATGLQSGAFNPLIAEGSPRQDTPFRVWHLGEELTGGDL
jgi:hypothetical protein